MRRREPQQTYRPPIPERLRRYDVSDWITAADSMVGAPTDAAIAALMVKVRRRWQGARAEWAAEDGYSAHGMYRVQSAHRRSQS